MPDDDTTIHMRINGIPYSISSDPRDFTAAELNAVERHTGMQVTEWADNLQSVRVSSLAWTALAWIAVRRSGDFVRWDVFEERVHLHDLLASVNDGAEAAAGTGGDATSAADSPTAAAPPPPAPNRTARRKTGTTGAKRKSLSAAPPLT